MGNSSSVDNSEEKKDDLEDLFYTSPVVPSMRDILWDLVTPMPSKKKDPNETDGGDPPIPVTLLSGFLGSGKTTLLKHILESREHGLKIAVIVNDMAELNIDASIIRQQQPPPPQNAAALPAHDEEEGASLLESSNDDKPQIVQTERRVVQLQNGCICCTLRGDLIREVARIRRAATHDYILIESTGIAEPQQVAESFVFDADTASLAKNVELMLWNQARLDTCVTVVDFHSFLGHMSTLEHFSDKFRDGLDTSTEEGREEGLKSIAHLLVDQVEFANVILLNKTDLATPEELRGIAEIVQKLNPEARLIPTEYAKVDLGDILNTRAFDLEAAKRSAGWLSELDHEHGEADEHGVGSFVFRARVPFHPQRLVDFLKGMVHFPDQWTGLPPEVRRAPTDAKLAAMAEHYGMVLRAKGSCWLAGTDTYAFCYAQTGRVGSLRLDRPWYTAYLMQLWATELPDDEVKQILSNFCEPHGDRRQELVFIGTGLRKTNLRAALEACLLTEDELARYEFYSDDGFE